MRDWRNVQVSETASISRAIELLNQEALRIVLVINRSQRLVGTVTDGDIRRGLIRGLTLESEVKEVMNQSPVTASSREPRTDLIKKMKSCDIFQIPILNSDGVVVDLETVQHLERMANEEVPVFIMAGGFGRRLRPLTEHVPKPLLVVGEKPILAEIVERFVSGGFRRIYISVHYKGDQIKSYFGSGQSWGAEIFYLDEDKPLGTAGALQLLGDSELASTMIVMNGDVVTRVDFGALLEFHRESKADGTICVREYELEIPYGVVEQRDSRVTEITEKPTQRFHVNAGIYVLNPSIRKKITPGEPLDMPDLLRVSIESGLSLTSFPIHEYWIDVGRKAEFERANREATEGQD